MAYVEREAAAAAVLVARMEEKTLDLAPVYDDLASLKCGPWRGKVDLVTAGFPCQPFSAAGQRKGKADERWLWPHIDRIIRELRPVRFVFLENVPPIVSHGLDAILGTLAECGFDAEWDVFSAGGPPPQGCEAPHLRKRFFLLGVADPDNERREVERGGGVLDSLGAPLGHYAHRSSDWSPWPPGPDDLAGWEQWIADGGPEPAVRRGALGSARRNERLHLLGNGVVPIQVALAWTSLAARLGVVI